MEPFLQMILNYLHKPSDSSFQSRINIARYILERELKHAKLRADLEKRNIPLETSEEGSLDVSNPHNKWPLKTPSMEGRIPPLQVNIDTKHIPTLYYKKNE